MQAASDAATAFAARQSFADAKQTYLEEAKLRFNLPAAQQQELQVIVNAVFQAACRQLEHDHQGLLESDKENSRVLNNRQVLLLSACTGSMDIDLLI